MLLYFSESRVYCFSSRSIPEWGYAFPIGRSFDRRAVSYTTFRDSQSILDRLCSCSRVPWRMAAYLYALVAVLAIHQPATTAERFDKTCVGRKWINTGAPEAPNWYIQIPCSGEAPGMEMRPRNGTENGTRVSDATLPTCSFICMHVAHILKGTSVWQSQYALIVQLWMHNKNK